MMKYLKTIIIALFFTLHIAAENFPYRMLSPIVMPRSEELRYLYIDSNGLIWIGTNMGVKSYDGYKTITIKSGINSPGLFPNNDILCITADHKENLWLGTRNGLVKLNLRTGKTQTYNELRVIYTLFTSRDGTVWIGTDNGLSRYIPQKDSILTYGKTNTITIGADGKQKQTKTYSVKAIVEDSKGNLFVGTWHHSLLRMDIKKGVFYQYPSFDERSSAYSLLLDSKGKLWVGTWGSGIVRLNQPYNHQAPQTQHLPFSTSAFNTIYNIIEDPTSKKIMASSREGIITIDNKEQPEMQTYTNIGGYQLTFSNRIVTDGEGNIWVGTANNGIVQFNTHPSPFTQFQFGKNSFNTSIYNVSTIFTPDGRHIWIGILPFGIALHDMATDETLVNDQIGGMENIGQQIMGSNFTCFEKSLNGDIWMGNWAGVVIRTPDSACKTLNIDNVDYLAENYISALKQAKNGTMWIGQRSGISIVRPDGKGYLLHPHEGKEDITPCDVRHVSEDKKGDIWVATNDKGIIRISNAKGNPDQMEYKQYAPAKGNLLVNDITNCLEDHAGRLWAISNSGGLFLYNKEQDKFEPKNKEYMIEGDRILAITEDRYGNLWLTEDQHLFKLSFVNGQPHITSYGIGDGLTDINFSANATTQYGDRLFFNTQNGYFIVNPTQLAKLHRKKKYNLIVSNIYIDDEPINELDSTTRANISEQQPQYTQRLTIPHSIKKLGIEFALLTHGNTDYIKYAYKLDGYQDKWIYTTSNQRTAYFQNLPAGSYTLHLQASDGDGQWTKLPYTIDIKVLPPWYATWWAYLIYTLMLLIAVKLIIEWYKNHLKTKNRLQMQVIFTNLTHELLTPLTVIDASIDELRAKSPTFEKHYQLMQNNINQATRLLRDILEVRKSQAGQLKLVVCEGDIANFLYNTCENLRPMANRRHVTFDVEIPEGTYTGWFDTDKLEKIVYNLLSNAFKYNKEHGSVRFSLKLTVNKATITVEDTGIGISHKKQNKLYTRFLDGDYRQKETKGTGIGLSLTYDLIKLHHGNIVCQSQLDKGTTFTVTIPINKSAYGHEEIDESHKISRFKITPTDLRQIEVIQEEMEENPCGQEPSDGYRILIVEDNEQLLHIMAQTLSKQYKVLTAKNGEQAWRIIQKESLDVVISDVMMPMMNGIELTQHIKQDPDFNRLPIILLTAMITEEDRDKAYEHGADEYITKPFKMKSLKRRIDNIIENRKRIRDSFASQTDFKVEDQHYSSPDEVFMKKALECVNQHISDSDYGRENFAADMCMSSSSLYNKFRTLTGQNITGFVNSVRLKKAYQMLEKNPDMPINEVALQTGFNSSKYFSQCFKKEFGILPSKLGKQE